MGNPVRMKRATVYFPDGHTETIPGDLVQAFDPLARVLVAYVPDKQGTITYSGVPFAVHSEPAHIVPVSPVVLT